MDRLPRRILLHVVGLLLAMVLGLGGGMLLLQRKAQAARTAAPSPGEVLSGQVMNVTREGRLDLLQWNGRRAMVRIRGVELKGLRGLTYLIDRASSQNVDVQVVSVVDAKQVCGDVSFLGLDLAVDLLKQGMAVEDLRSTDPIPENARVRALAEAEARALGRGAWGSGGWRRSH